MLQITYTGKEGMIGSTYFGLSLMMLYFKDNTLFAKYTTCLKMQDKHQTIIVTFLSSLYFVLQLHTYQILHLN